MNQTDKNILSVSQLNRQARMLLETQLPLIWVEGEISNLARPTSGHWYFTLKDSQAQVRCAMFRNRNTSVRFAPNQGSKVLLRARVSLYEGRGEFQLIVEHMSEAGVGDLQRQFEELKARLLAEGLFDEAWKKPLPDLPRHIGVITSATGAVIHDIIHVLGRRFPGIEISLLPVSVQGERAVDDIVEALSLANAQTDCEVLIVGRGGGSLEDLQAFNDERVARAIFQSRIPVISAVGHETDFSIADFVADTRAPTPSAAAELISPDGRTLLEGFEGFALLLQQAMQRKIQQCRGDIRHISRRLRHPGDRLRHQAQRLDLLEQQFMRAMTRILANGHQAVENRKRRLPSPQTQLQLAHRQLAQQSEKLNTGMGKLLEQKRQRLQHLAQMLNTVNPLNTLKRGYAIVSDEEAHIVTDANTVSPGDKVRARLAAGELECRVEHVHTSNH